MKLKELIMNSKIITIKEKLILIDSIKKDKINNEQLKIIIKNLSTSKKKVDTEIEQGKKEIKKKYIKNMQKKLPIVKTKITKIKLKTKEAISKQEEGDPEKLLDQI